MYETGNSLSAQLRRRTSRGSLRACIALAHHSQQRSVVLKRVLGDAQRAPNGMTCAGCGKTGDAVDSRWHDEVDMMFSRRTDGGILMWAVDELPWEWALSPSPRRRPLGTPGGRRYLPWKRYARTRSAGRSGSGSAGTTHAGRRAADPRRARRTRGDRARAWMPRHRPADQTMPTVDAPKRGEPRSNRTAAGHLIIGEWA